jgi:hypothetical protein
MAAIDLFTHPGQAGVDPARQKALLVSWLLLNSNSLLTYPQTRIVKNDQDLAKAKADGQKPGSLINYLDLRDLYPRLAPLTAAEVDDLFDLARRTSDFQSVASAYWSEGESMWSYADHYCLAVPDVLAMNK